MRLELKLLFEKEWGKRDKRTKPVKIIVFPDGKNKAIRIIK